MRRTATRRFEASFARHTATATQDPGCWHIYDDTYGELVADIDPDLPPDKAAAEVSERAKQEHTFWYGATIVTCEDDPP